MLDSDERIQGNPSFSNPQKRGFSRSNGPRPRKSKPAGPGPRTMSPSSREAGPRSPSPRAPLRPRHPPTESNMNGSRPMILAARNPRSLWRSAHPLHERGGLRGARFRPLTHPHRASIAVRLRFGPLTPAPPPLGEGAFLRRRLPCFAFSRPQAP